MWERWRSVRSTDGGSQLRVLFYSAGCLSRWRAPPYLTMCHHWLSDSEKNVGITFKSHVAWRVFVTSFCAGTVIVMLCALEFMMVFLNQ